MSVQGVALSFCFIVLVLPLARGGYICVPIHIAMGPMGVDVPGGSPRSCPPCYKKGK